MSLILCRQEPVTRPLYIDKLGIHLFSSQELCYVIYQYPLMALDGFVDDRLREFIADQLDMGFLSAKLEKCAKSGAGDEEQLLMILQECDYYSAAEVNRYKNQLSSYRKMRREEYDKATADFYYSRGQYKAAVEGYEKILSYSRDQVMDDEFAARIWNNIGASYAGIFWFDKAMEAYDMSYGFSRSTETLKRIYQLTLFSPDLTVKERYHKLMTEEMKGQWAREAEEAKKTAYETDEIQQAVLMFQKDPVKRAAGCEERLNRWKREYRAMI